MPQLTVTITERHVIDKLAAVTTSKDKNALEKLVSDKVAARIVKRILSPAKTRSDVTLQRLYTEALYRELKQSENNEAQ